MRATSDRELFVCLTSDGRVADGIAIDTVDSVDTLRTRLRELPADGVLVGEDRAEEWLASSDAFRREFPAVPVIVFTDDRDATFVEQALGVDMSDVIRATLASTPRSLIRARFDGIRTDSNDPVPAISSNESTPAASGDGSARAVTERYETILNTAADAIYQLDTDGRIVAANDAMTELTGYSREELIGTHISTYLDDETTRQSEQFVREQLDGDGGVDILEADIETKDGENVPCEIRISALTAGGEFAGTVGVVRDIRDKLEREQKLEERSRLLEDISQSINEAVWVEDPDEPGDTFLSAGYEDIWGWPREEVYEDGKAFIERLHPDDRDRVERAFEMRQEDPDSYDITYRVIRPDGELRWVDSEAFGVYDDGGELDRIVGIATDITERKRVQKQLEAERDMFAKGPAVIFRWQNKEGWPVEYVSENVEEVLGYSPSELTAAGLPYEDLVHEDDRPRVQREVEMNRGPETEQFSHEPYRLRTADGDVRWVKDTTRIIREDGEITHYQGYLVDITERKKREQALQMERDHIERIYETSPIGFGVFNRDGFLTRVNDRTAEIFGVDRETLLDTPLTEIPIALCNERGEQIPFSEFPVWEILETGEPIYGRELCIRCPDGDTVWISWNGEPILDADDTVTSVVATVEDITERKRREEKIATQRDELAELDRINRIIRDVDDALIGATSREEIEQTVCERLTASGRYHFALSHRLTPDGDLEPKAWTPEGEKYVEQGFPMENVTPETSPGARALATGTVQVIQSLRDIEDPDPWQEVAMEVGIEALAAVPIIYDGRKYGIIGVYATQQDAFSERELDVLEELGGTTGHAIAALESREREEMLTALYEATQDLLTAETAQAVSDVVVETANEVLGPPGIGVFLFDDDRNALVPTAATDELLSYYGTPAVFGPGEEDAVAWQAYATGEPQVYQDIRDAERIANPDTDARSTLILPMGEHGVFVVASPNKDGFVEQKRRLVGLLAATTEAALGRVAGRADIRERDRQLAERSSQLARIEDTLELVCTVSGELRTAPTTEELYEGVCERIAEFDTLQFAWFGTVPPGSDRLVPQTWAGEDGGYLDEAKFDSESDEPAVKAAHSGEPVVVDDVTDHLQQSSWALPAIDRNFQSIIAVPLLHGETSRGVLAVYSTESRGFGRHTERAFDELARSVAYSSSVIETREALLDTEVTELELDIGGTDSPLNTVAEIAGEPVTYREQGAGVAETVDVTFSLSDPPVEAILALETERVAVDTISHVERGNDHEFTTTLTTSTVASTLLNCAGIPRQVVADAENTRATVHLADSVDVRAFLERVRDSYPDTDLISRRTVDRENAAADFQSMLDERLTERQREVLVAAYESGFFESPRATTGSELAEQLGVSQPTITHHLREAQRRLFAGLLAPEE